MFIFNVWSESEKISFDSPDDDPFRVKMFKEASFPHPTGQDRTRSNPHDNAQHPSPS